VSQGCGGMHTWCRPRLYHALPNQYV
jgi:hypothetical protein